MVLCLARSVEDIMRERIASTLLVASLVLAALIMAHPIQASGPPRGQVIYIVQQGDNLASIAHRFRTSYRVIMRDNGLTSPLIHPGQRLIIATGYMGAAGGAGTSLLHDGCHVVWQGETLSGIAARYRVPVALLKLINGLHSDHIYVGQCLRIPRIGLPPMFVTPVPDEAAPSSPEASSDISCGSTYRVRRGDTLTIIARRCGTTVTDLQRANNLSGSFIWVGQLLTVPQSGRGGSWGSGPTPTPTPTLVPLFDDVWRVHEPVDDPDTSRH